MVNILDIIQELYLKVRAGIKRADVEVEEGTIKAYRMGNIIRIDVDVKETDDIPL